MSWFSEQTRRPGGGRVGLVDTAPWKAELTADGFPRLHPAARQFLTEFGGLVVGAGGPTTSAAGFYGAAAGAAKSRPCRRPHPRPGRSTNAGPA